MKKRFIIDGDNFSDFQGFTKEFSFKVLSNKHIWKGNLDAFNDILRGGFGDIEEDDEVEIVWKNSKKSINDLSYDETIRRLNEILVNCHPTNKEFVLQKIRLAESNQGSTVFDLLIEIVKEHENKNINLILE
jgi:RNAse (barnase) inhibitor barstar